MEGGGVVPPWLRQPCLGITNGRASSSQQWIMQLKSSHPKRGKNILKSVTNTVHTYLTLSGPAFLGGSMLEGEVLSEGTQPPLETWGLFTEKEILYLRHHNHSWILNRTEGQNFKKKARWINIFGSQKVDLKYRSRWLVVMMARVQ